MAAVTFTRKAASELRGRFHLALESRLASARMRRARRTADDRGCRRRSRISNASSPAPFTRSARVCCASVRSNPACRPASPSSTKCRTSSCASASGASSSPARARRATRTMLALLEADVQPKDLDSAFATICVNDDVEFPPGDGVCPDPKPAWKALEQFWKELQKHLPAVDRRRHHVRDSASGAAVPRAVARVARSGCDRPAVVAALLDTWDCESKITQKWWADIGRGEEASRDLIEPLHDDFRADVVEPYLAAVAAVRLPAVRSACSPGRASTPPTSGVASTR